MNALPPLPGIRRRACLEVTADHCPQVLLRVLGLIARHAAIPHGILIERDQSSLRIEVEVDALAPAHLRTLNFKIEDIPTVRSSRIRDVRSGAKPGQTPAAKLS
jgi:acetolactate synthase regulatory subunit